MWNKFSIPQTKTEFTKENIPTIPEKNTAGKAVIALLSALNLNTGFTIKIQKGIPPGSGIGSSASSAVGAVFRVNQILGSHLNPNELLVHAMAGEAVASGGFHADNVAPTLLGGMVLIRSYEPLDIIQIPIPETPAPKLVHISLVELS